MDKKRTILRNSSKISTIYATPHRIAQHPAFCSVICDIHDFYGNHLWCWWSLLWQYSVRPRVILHNITSMYHTTFILLVFLLQLRILQMTNVNQCCEMYFHFFVSCFFDHFRFVSDFRQIPQNFLKFSHSLSTASFAAVIFMAWVIGINLCTKLYYSGKNDYLLNSEE